MPYRRSYVRAPIRASYRRKREPLLFNMILSTSLSILLNAYFGKPIFHSSMLSVGLHLWGEEVVMEDYEIEAFEPNQVYASLEQLPDNDYYLELRQRIRDL